LIKKSAFLLFIILLSACYPSETTLMIVHTNPWLYSDLRALDPVDAGEDANDLIALYVRLYQDTVEVRLDFLEYSLDQEPDILVLFDLFPGGVRSNSSSAANFLWDIAIQKDSQGILQAYDWHYLPLKNLKLQFLSDPEQDYVIIRFKNLWGNSVLYQSSIQAILPSPDNQQTIDSTQSVRFSSPPPDRVPLLLAFWNTFDGSTPSQALRRWNGAHTGPNSSRHGLFNLLEAVRKTGIPVVLLDLKAYGNLRVLDFLDAIKDIKDLAEDDLLLLPDVLNVALDADSIPSVPPSLIEWVFTKSLTMNDQSAIKFGLPPSLYVFTVSDMGSGLVSQPYVLFLGDCVVCEGCMNLCLKVLVNGYTKYSGVIHPSGATLTGPNLEFRKRLVSSAVQKNPQLVIEGGNFVGSYWGESQAVLATLDYIKQHPWIQTLDQNGFEDCLLTKCSGDSGLATQETSTVEGEPSNTAPENLSNSQLVNLAESLYSTVEKKIFSFGWEFFQSLLTPTTLSLDRLRINYESYLGLLLSAADWGENPGYLADCSRDFDGDQVPECILASEEFYLLIKLNGGYILLALYSSPEGLIQIIAPSYQFVIGFSDPSEWNYDNGITSDPGMIPGALADRQHLDEQFSAEFSGSTLTISNSDNTIQKTIELTHNAIEFNLIHPQTQEWSLPLLWYSQDVYRENWAVDYQVKILVNELYIGYANNSSLVVTSDQVLQATSFLDSRPYLLNPEDPNFAYPAGHYLPFPFFMINLSSPGSATVKLQVNSP
jgi:hypothetical protein